MNILAEIQREFLNNDIVLVIDADILLPRIGGYNARPYSSKLQLYELPRPSEIKALWRWWLRVILSTIHNGQKTYSELDKEACEILGSTQKQSLFSVIVDINYAKRVLEQSSSKMEQFKQLLLEIIPKVLEEFVKKYNSDKKFKKIAELGRIKLIPISMRFTNIKSFFNNLRQEIKKKFGLELKPIRRRKEAELRIRNSQELLVLMKRLGMNYNERTIQLYDEIVKLIKIPRIVLLKQPRRDEGEDDKFKFKFSEGNRRYLKRVLEDIASIAATPTRIFIRIVIAVNKDKKLELEKLKLAVASLLLSLLLGGLGSIRGRGFGSLALKSVKAGSKYKDSLIEVIERVNRILQASNKDELKKRLIKYMEFVLNLTSKVFGKGLLYAHGESPKIPEVPALLPNTDYFRLEVFECRKHADVIGVLESIGKTTLKVQWKREYDVSEKKPGGEFHTWILGLPRSVIKGRVEKTGYFVNEDSEDRGRRLSAITFKIFENNQGKKYVIVYGFLSHDWPLDRLIHRNNRRGKKVTELPIRVPSQQEPITSSCQSEEYLKYVFEAAFEFITRILEKECRGHEA